MGREGSIETSERDRLRQLGEAAVLAAGRALRDGRGAWALAERTEGHDVKLLADRAAEAMTIELLRSASDLPVYSEEIGLVGESQDAVHWVLDPLDGSANYLRGVPLCCVSLALVAGGEPLIGLVYDFNADELFCGVVGEGAWLNGRAMHVSAVSVVNEALLTTGFPVGLSDDAQTVAEYIEGVRQFRKVRSLGSAALMLAYVACGRFDAYREHDVRFWDVAAGMALVLAAGGAVRHASDESGSGRHLDLLAWNGRLEL